MRISNTKVRLGLRLLGTITVQASINIASGPRIE